MVSCEDIRCWGGIVQQSWKSSCDRPGFESEEKPICGNGKEAREVRRLRVSLRSYESLFEYGVCGVWPDCLFGGDAVSTVQVGFEADASDERDGGDGEASASDAVTAGASARSTRATRNPRPVSKKSARQGRGARPVLLLSLFSGLGIGKDYCGDFLLFYQRVVGRDVG